MVKIDIEVSTYSYIYVRLSSRVVLRTSDWVCIGSYICSYILNNLIVQLVVAGHLTIIICMKSSIIHVKLKISRNDQNYLTNSPSIIAQSE